MKEIDVSVAVTAFAILNSVLANGTVIAVEVDIGDSTLNTLAKLTEIVRITQSDACGIGLVVTPVDTTTVH
jgi:hypothetical protein